MNLIASSLDDSMAHKNETIAISRVSKRFSYMSHPEEKLISIYTGLYA